MTQHHATPRGRPGPGPQSQRRCSEPEAPRQPPAPEPREPAGSRRRIHGPQVWEQPGGGGHTPVPNADTGSGSALAEATAQVVSFCLNLKRQRLAGEGGAAAISPSSPSLPSPPSPAAPRGHPWDIQKPMARPAPCGPRALGSAGAEPSPGRGAGGGAGLQAPGGSRTPPGASPCTAQAAGGGGGVSAAFPTGQWGGDGWEVMRTEWHGGDPVAREESLSAPSPLPPWSLLYKLEEVRGHSGAASSGPSSQEQGTVGDRGG